MGFWVFARRHRQSDGGEAVSNITLPREVVQEAVKALEFAERNHDGEQSLYTTEIAALRKALAAEQQEPVADEEAPRLWAWMREGWSADCGPWYEVIRNDQMTWRDRKGWTPLYTALAALDAALAEPDAKREPATDVQVTELCKAKGIAGKWSCLDYHTGWRDAERFHGIGGSK